MEHIESGIAQEVIQPKDELWIERQLRQNSPAGNSAFLVYDLPEKISPKPLALAEIQDLQLDLLHQVAKCPGLHPELKEQWLNRLAGIDWTLLDPNSELKGLCEDVEEARKELPFGLTSDAMESAKFEHALSLIEAGLSSLDHKCSLYRLKFNAKDRDPTVVG